MNFLWGKNLTNHYYCGDCLYVLNHDIPPESVDLIYLDPPFFTGAEQKGEVWRPEAMPISFSDSKDFWKKKEILTKAPEWMKHIAVKRPDFASYLYYMMERLQACYRVLKNTGSIYLHCDYRASHYLKMVIDEVFDVENFQREIIWNTGENISGFKSKARNWIRQHDTIFFYTKSESFVFNKQFRPWSEGQLSEFKHKDENGRVYKLWGTLKDQHKQYLDENPGIPLGDIWNDIHSFQYSYLAKKESVGYPTQKPLALLERIIKASSNQGDVVLDPFCGCGTALKVAWNLGRKWIGIDIHPKAYEIIKNRFENSLVKFTSEVIFHERKLEEVMSLDASDFEKWVNDMYNAVKPSPDKGVDGITKDGIPIQTKIWVVKYDTVGSFKNSALYHPKVPQPVKKMILVSQKGFDSSAHSMAWEIKSKEGIDIELVEPKKLIKNLNISSAKYR